MRWAKLIVTSSLLATACGPDTIEPLADTGCEPLFEDDACRILEPCVACLGLDPEGVGACRVGLEQLSPDEMVTILRWATSSRDRCRAWDDDIALPLADMVLALVAAGAFIDDDGSLSLEGIKAAVVGPETVGHPELEGLEVRMYGGAGNGACWGGLADFLARGAPASPPAATCCSEPGCSGVDYRCAEPGADGLLRVCEAL